MMNRYIQCILNTPQEELKDCNIGRMLKLSVIIQSCIIAILAHEIKVSSQVVDKTKNCLAADLGLSDIIHETIFRDDDRYMIDEVTFVCRLGKWEKEMPGPDHERNDKLKKYSVKRLKRSVVDSAVEGVKIGSAIGSIFGGVGSIVGGVIGGIGGAIACIFVCREPDPPNNPPYVTCPENMMDLYALRGEESRVVTWETPTGHDNEDGSLPATLVQGDEPGSLFQRGTHTIIYSVTDSKAYTATCNFQIRVSVINCLPIPWPVNGYVYCGQVGFIWGTSCDVGCNDGFEISTGTSNNRQSVVCEKDSNNGGIYDIDIPTCTAIICNGNASELHPENGNAVCTHSSYKYDTSCFTSCNSGYSSSGLVPTTCQDDGTWSSSLKGCQDSEPPTLSNCPGTLSVYADRGETSATLFWNAPIASDNSGNVTLEQTLGSPPGSVFEEGLHEIRYRAIDGRGNTSPECIFFLQVEQLRCDPPSIDDRFLIYECPEGFTYGSMCTLKCMGSFQLVGNANITCEQDGEDMNWSWDQTKQHCDTNPCEALNPPTNGAMSCARWLFGQQCQMQCGADMDIPLGTVNSNGQAFTGIFTCSETTGTYIPDTVPDCTARRRPNIQYLNGEFFYFTGDCNDADVLETIKQNFINQMQILETTGYEGVCPDSTECNVDNVDVTCGPTSGKRRKRESSLIDKLMDLCRIRRSTHTHEIRVDFRVTIVPNDTSRTPIDSFYYYEGVMNDMSDEIRELVQNGGMDVGGLTADSSTYAVGFSEVICPDNYNFQWSTLKCVPCSEGTYLNGSTQSCHNCPVGTYKDTVDSASCTQCPLLTSTLGSGATNSTQCIDICSPGYYSSTGLAPCHPCSKSLYQNEYQSTQCHQCPPGLTTAYTGSISSDNCTAFDLHLSSKEDNISLGSFNESVMSWTLASWINFNSTKSSIEILFQSASGVSSIQVSPLNTTLNLLTDKSTHQIELQDGLWNHISSSVDFASKRWKLYINGQETFNSAFTMSKIDDNYRLQSGGNIVVTAMESDRVGISQFLMFDYVLTTTEITILSNSCVTTHPSASLSPASLNQTSVEGHITVPSQCDDTNNCLPNPCNGYNCTDGLDSFICHCENGYSGSKCENEPNPCSNSPCINGGTCHNAADDYQCSCPTGFKGKNCHVQIINGGWSDWMEWSVCSETCGGGVRLRSRLCNSPPPDSDGVPCKQSLSNETDSCNTEDCPTCGSLRRGYGNVLSCSLTNDSHQICTVSCRDGLTFLPNNLPDDEYICGPNTSYSWSNNHTLPACSRPRGPLSVSTTTVFTYTSMTCTEASSAVTMIQQSSSQYQCVHNGTCTMSTDTPDCTTGIGKRSTTVNVHITFTVQLQNNSDLSLETLTSIENASEALRDLIVAVQEIETSTIQLNESSSVRDIILNGVTYSSSAITTTVNVLCSEGQGSLNAFCLDCPVGTYSINGKCELCQKGTYQDQTGQTACLPCPSGLTTAIVAASNITYCTVLADLTSTSTTDSTSGMTQTIASEPTATGMTNNSESPLKMSSTPSSENPSTTTLTPVTSSDIFSTTTSTPATSSEISSTMNSLPLTSDTSSRLSTSPSNNPSLFGKNKDGKEKEGKEDDDDGEEVPVLLIVLLSAITVLIIVGIVIATLLVVKQSKRRKIRKGRRQGSIASLSMVRPYTEEKLEITDYENCSGVYENDPPPILKY